MKLFIITGASKGLGLSLTTLALDKNAYVISIARSPSFKHDNLIHIKHDLTKPKGIEAKLDRALLKIDLKKIKSIHLINNAAFVEPIGEVQNLDFGQIENHLKLNLLSPIIISGWFLKNFKKKKCPQIIVNISSGAAFTPLQDWSIYCSSKSGLHMFTKCLLTDNSENKYFRALSFSPGVMDTGMQSTIRNQKKSNFKNLNKFKELKDKNLLLSPDKVASGLLELLEIPEKINEDHYDIRKLLT